MAGVAGPLRRCSLGFRNWIWRHLQTELGEAAAETLVAEKAGGLPEFATFRCPDVGVTQDVLSACFEKHLPIAIIGAHLPAESGGV